MKRTSIALLLLLLLTACGTAAEETPPPEEELDYVTVVSVTGKVVPDLWSTLSAQIGGTVVEVAVEPGDAVAAGDLLLRLDPTDAGLAVQQAEAALLTAEAQLALLQAGPRSQDVAAVQAQLATAEAVLAQALAQRDQATAGDGEAQVAAARAQLAAAQAEEWIAYDLVRREGWRIGEIAALQYDAAAAARAAAEAQVAQAEQSSSAQSRAAAAAVLGAAAQRDAAQAQLERLQAGATAEEVAVAQAAVAQAEAALAVTRVNLERCQVRAPFAGTVGAVHVRIDELVVPGQPLAVLGDLSTLQVETTDLDEIDVARVTAGQPVVVTFDALPERTFDGAVERIAPMAASAAGGVHYTTIVTLNDIDPTIRWGMTAFVDIEVEE